MPGQLCRIACPHTSSEVIRRPSANGRRYRKGPHMRAFSGHGNEADTRTRTGDPFITRIDRGVSVGFRVFPLALCSPGPFWGGCPRDSFGVFPPAFTRPALAVEPQREVEEEFAGGSVARQCSRLTRTDKNDHTPPERR